MPKFLEDKLRSEYGDNKHAIYGTMNAIGAMHGNKETAKGREMERKHFAHAKPMAFGGVAVPDLPEEDPNDPNVQLRRAREAQMGPMGAPQQPAPPPPPSMVPDLPPRAPVPPPDPAARSVSAPEPSLDLSPGIVKPPSPDEMPVGLPQGQMPAALSPPPPPPPAPMPVPPQVPVQEPREQADQAPPEEEKLQEKPQPQPQATQAAKTGPQPVPSTKMGPNMIKGNATQEALDYAKQMVTQVNPKTGQEEYKRPKTWQNVLGILGSISPLTRRIDMHPNLTRQYENLGVLQSRADEERKLQVAQAIEDEKRSAVVMNNETRLAAAASRGQLAPRLLPGTLQKADLDAPGKLRNYRQLWDPATKELTDIDAGAFVNKPSTGQPREFASNIITMENARWLAANADYKFKRADGSLWDLARIPDNMVMHRVGADPLTSYFDVVNPREVTTTANNVMSVTDPFHRSNIPSGGPGVTVLGQARVPTVGTRQEMGMDPAGNPRRNVYTSTSTPITGPYPGGSPVLGQVSVRGSAPATPQGQPVPQGSAPRAPAATPLARPPAAPMAPSAGAGGTLYPTPAARQAQLAKVGPVREASAQLFGDKSQPGMTSLLQFYKLADDPHAQATTGKFLRMVIDSMKKEEAGHAGVGGTLGPVSLNAGGFGQWLQELTGIPGAVSAEQIVNMKKALAAMTPEEKAYANAFLAARSGAVGLRAATGAGAYKFATDALELDLPYLGFNTDNSTMFLDKMQHIAGIAANGIKNYDRALIDQGSPGTYDRIMNLHNELEMLKSKPGGGPSGGGGAPVKVQRSPSTGQYRHSRDGGKTWQPGQPSQ